MCTPRRRGCARPPDSERLAGCPQRRRVRRLRAALAASRTAAAGRVKRVRARQGGGGDCGGLGTCSVCLDDFGDGAVVRTLPCLHHFHDACVDPWLRQQGLAAPCPVCKTPVFQAP